LFCVKGSEIPLAKNEREVTVGSMDLFNYIKDMWIFQKHLDYGRR
jgi:hypothetical protein